MKKIIVVILAVALFVSSCSMPGQTLPTNSDHNEGPPPTEKEPY